MRTPSNPLKGVYNKHPRRETLYELNKPSLMPFDFIVFSKSRAEYLKRVGANTVVNCWKEKKKILHSGLIHVYANWYFGDNLSGDSAKDLLILQMLPKQVRLFMFEKFNPKKKFEFVEQFIVAYILKKGATV